MQVFTLLGVFFPIAAGLLLYMRKPIRERWRNTVIVSLACITSVFLLAAILATLFSGTDVSAAAVIDFGHGIGLAFRLDTPAIVFTSIIAVLWPLTTVYGFSYIKGEHKPNISYGYFILSYGIAAGIGLAENFITLCLFYALMSFLPLPMHRISSDSVSREDSLRYVRHFLLSTAMILFAVVLLYIYGRTGNFVYGGVLDPAKTGVCEPLLQAAYILGFFGFQVKAVAYPVHGWFQTKKASHGSDTVLLYEIAIINAVVFSVMRLTFYGFGTGFLSGSPAQYIVLAAGCAAVIYGSCAAIRSQKMKHRLGYSTVSNLSYIFLAIAAMTPEGMAGGLLYLIYHSLFKLTLFFCTGAIRHQTHREYISELEGLHTKMPVTCFAFLVGALGLIGIPPLGGFISKLTIGITLVSLHNPAGIIGAAVLIFSATLTVIYLVTILISFYFPLKESRPDTLTGIREADAGMRVPVILICILSVILSFLSAPLLSALNGIGSIL